ncbi:hypothetical protein HDU97_000045 [Phlyctochytrium planicorne]|nr:hypothetical protein HDU97_000045 [Phlyctochytrium planicorne]
MTTVCCTADPTWGATQMLLNVTVKSEDNANAQLYNVTVSFPTTYTMGPQPYRAPVGNVKCDEPIIQATTKSYHCYSSNSPNFFAIFNMITPNNESPKVGAKITLSTMTGAQLDCPASVWCPDVGSNAGGGGGAAGGPMPVWQITVIAVGCGVFLAGAVFVFAKWKLRPQREVRTDRNPNSNPIPGGGAAGTLMEKVAAAQKARVGADAPTGAELLMQKVEAARRKSEVERKDELPPGPGTLLEKVAEAKRLKSLHDLTINPGSATSQRPTGPASPNPSVKLNDANLIRTKSNAQERKHSTSRAADTPTRAPRDHSVERRFENSTENISSPRGRSNSIDRRREHGSSDNLNTPRRTREDSLDRPRQRSNSTAARAYKDHLTGESTQRDRSTDDRSPRGSACIPNPPNDGDHEGERGRSGSRSDVHRSRSRSRPDNHIRSRSVARDGSERGERDAASSPAGERRKKSTREGGEGRDGGAVASPAGERRKKSTREGGGERGEGRDVSHGGGERRKKSVKNEKGEGGDTSASASPARERRKKSVKDGAEKGDGDPSASPAGERRKKSVKDGVEKGANDAAASPAGETRKKSTRGEREGNDS